ncbi:inner membrane magnesium transporter mrs2 [Colletotrichum truncatum]|uniref:Inner membrane magnesium transporter mrs2 n=1 Tax=Colletotrichum truncatum TaxID=5467 RepID=A0ACC3ZH60_COLTU|nr:inner membrane magnesium transporter mrs2 [Colletotrichum truncatum]KAF6790619.1 inner membrane magnesium transporter mrs2 [Colletotrichum truncatum]
MGLENSQSERFRATLENVQQTQPQILELDRFQPHHNVLSSDASMAMRLVRPNYRLCLSAHRLTLRLFTTKSSSSFTFQNASPTPTEPKRLRCTEVDENGVVTVRFISAKKTELTTRYGLVPRDIRKIEASTLSHIGIRPSTVLLHLFHLKVLVQRDRALVFDDATSPASRSAFLREIQEGIRQRDTAVAKAAAGQREDESYGQPQPTFEFLALEAVLSSVVSELEGELDAVRRPVERVLKSLEDDVDRRALLALLNISGRATRLAAQAELVLTAVEDVLDWDDSLAALYLSAKAADKDGRGKTADDDLTVAEALLGSYYVAYNEIVQETQSLVSSIRNTQESASAILDANRNSLMLLDLKFRMGTLGLATGAFFSAFYGMNISNYILEFTWAFPGVCGVSAILAVATSYYGLTVLRKIMRVKMEGHKEPRSLGSSRWSRTQKR